MKRITYLFILILFFNSCQQKSVGIKIYTDQNVLDELSYAIEKLESHQTGSVGSVTVVTDEQEANLILRLSLQYDIDSEKNDGFELSKSDNGYQLSSECSRGLLYGLLDISEQLSNGASWGAIQEKSIRAHHDFRAIKFNLPWYSYRSGENLALHTETCRDLKFWESFLDMMVENKFNALTLWNMHPYMYMVKSESFPKASPFTDAEMAEWKKFWKGLFKMAKDRGVDTYVINWNIFLPEAFSKEYGAADYSSETGAGYFGEGETNEYIEAYMREMVTLTINKYENLTGIGLTLGERMGGMTSEERKDWVNRTMIAGLKEADRKARLLYRAPLSAGTNSGGSVSVTTEKLTRDAIENLDLDDDVWISFKFNWSHGHTSPKLSIVHGGMLTDTYWEPYSEKYKGVWTMRNEDFFVMRWGDPDFIREFLDLNSQKYIGGCIIGSETYIPAKDYFTKEEHRSWDYAFERQWLFYKVWGNLLYNRNISDSYFIHAIEEKFELEDGKELLEAWKLASKNPNRLASFFGSTWDATVYSEGFKTNEGKFIDINTFISRNVLDSSYINIEDFVAESYDKSTQITPLELAAETEKQSARILEIVKKQRKKGASPELEIELTDLEFWANYGFYFAMKVRAGVALESFRKGIDANGQQKAVEILTKGLGYWVKMTELAEKYNVKEMPYQFDQEFSWRKHIVDAEYDIMIAKDNLIK
ncbi:hypothetical protein [uncultured Draconibacterium sp.]|uniref:hypothetical protein n=1 Tax=uncultured Draconibacterium sp. TaxID=1573823 RepID=UPI0029C7ABE3|nr:hypothetical protein [uncultured Draconibacterium sp.]